MKSQRDADAHDAANITAGSGVIADNCTECHIFHGSESSTGPRGPDLTGYGSRAWLINFISDPAHKRFYGKDNDRMPSFAESAADAKKSNILTEQELELLSDWLRGEWYEPEGK